MNFILYLFILGSFFHLNKAEDYATLRNSYCNTRNCDENGGICDENICKCKDNFTTSTKGNAITIYQNSNFYYDFNFKFCNYERKRALYAAVMEFFMGFGMGHFYSGRKINGCIKLIFFITLFCTSFCSLVIGIKLAENQGITDFRNLNNLVPENYANLSAVKFYFFIFACIINVIFIWQIFDFLMFILKIYLDGNGINLY